MYSQNTATSNTLTKTNLQFTTLLSSQTSQLDKTDPGKNSWQESFRGAKSPPIKQQTSFETEDFVSEEV